MRNFQKRLNKLKRDFQMSVNYKNRHFIKHNTNLAMLNAKGYPKE